MRIIKHKTNFDFVGKRRPAIIVSTVLNLAIILGIAIFGFNYGVDFAGGTLVELKFPYSIEASDVRRAAERGGLHDVSVQSIGQASENAFILRMGGVTQLTKEGATKVEEALKAMLAQGEQSSSQGLSYLRVDLDNGLVNFRTNQKVDPEAVKSAVESSGTGVKEVRELGEAQGGGFDYQVVSAGMADRVQAGLKAGLEKPEFEVRRVDYVGPQVGKQLRYKGLMALIYSMIAILLYIAFRFDFKFGPGALAAMLHDLMMTAGYYFIGGFFGREFNLTSIAALLTIIGYSVNDTIVIYDRIREEMVRFKGKPLPEIINIAINYTLSRTILTSGVTALSLVGLLIFGVGEIWDFAMATLVGIIVGTYSSVYVASPLTIWLDERAAARSRGKGKSAPSVKAKVA